MSTLASAASIKDLLRDAFATSLSVDGVGALMSRVIDTYFPFLHESHQAFVQRLRGAGPYRNELNAILKRFRKAEEKKGRVELAVAKEVTKNARIAFSGCLVLLAYENCRSSLPSLLFGSEDFRSMYPNLGHGDALVAFRNFMMVSLWLEPAKNNKALHIDICARLSERSSDVRYVTGSGQSRATSQRVAIYEREGNVQPEPSRRAKRSVDVSDTSSEDSDSVPSSKRSRTASVSSASSISSEDGMSDFVGDFALARFVDDSRTWSAEVSVAHASADVYCDGSDVISELGDLDGSSVAAHSSLGDDLDFHFDTVAGENDFDELTEVLSDDFCEFIARM